MKKYKEIHVLGDSFTTTHNFLPVAESFYGLLAKDVNAETIYNFSQPGRSWKSIKHYIINNHEKYEKISLFRV